LNWFNRRKRLAGAELDYIDSVFAHNVAKLALLAPWPRSGKPAEVP